MQKPRSRIKFGEVLFLGRVLLRDYYFRAKGDYTRNRIMNVYRALCEAGYEIRGRKHTTDACLRVRLYQDRINARNQVIVSQHVYAACRE